MRKKKTEMESEGKQYMLFMFGDFADNETFVNDVSYNYRCELQIYEVQLW